MLREPLGRRSRPGRAPGDPRRRRGGRDARARGRRRVAAARLPECGGRRRARARGRAAKRRSARRSRSSGRTARCSTRARSPTARSSWSPPPGAVVPLTLGTAGHIDHGKTALVEALTGTTPTGSRRNRRADLDRARVRAARAPERAAPVGDRRPRPRALRADDGGGRDRNRSLPARRRRGRGPAAQTFEHVEILKLLGVERGVIALTKIDAVDSDRIEEPVGLVPGAEIVRVERRHRGRPGRVVRGARPRRGCRRSARARRRDTSVRRPRLQPAGSGDDRHRDAVVGAGCRWRPARGAADGIRSARAQRQVHGEPVERAEAGQRVAVALAAERRRRPNAATPLSSPAHIR